VPLDDLRAHPRVHHRTLPDINGHHRTLPDITGRYRTLPDTKFGPFLTGRLGIPDCGHDGHDEADHLCADADGFHFFSLSGAGRLASARGLDFSGTLP
jgi:hypothetical protein